MSQVLGFRITFGDAADDVDSRAPVQGNLAASAMEVVVERSVRHERVDEEAFRAPFGAAESQERDEIFMFDLHQGFDRHLKVVLSDCESRVVDGLHSHHSAVSQCSFVHSSVGVFPQQILLGEVVCGCFKLA